MDEANEVSPRGWWKDRDHRPDGFGGVTPGTWQPKWQHTPTRAIRVPDCMADLLIELARASDQHPDPTEWLRSLRTVQPIAAIEDKAVQSIDWDKYNVAQLRQIARERGLKTARAANRAELLEFLNR